jgi:hypothetical protein
MASDCTPKPGTFRAFAHMINREVGILWVLGVASCRTGGHKCELRPAVPQGINPTILILNLECQHGGHTDVIQDVPVVFVQTETRPHTSVTIEPGGVNVHVTTI